MDVLYSMLDSTVLIGCTVAAAIAGFIMVMMKYSFSSQEEKYGEHISTLYGSGSAQKSKAAKAAEKKKKAKQAKAEQIKLSAKKSANTDYGHHHVAINPEPEILGENGQGDEADNHNKPQPRKRRGSILHNKDEVPLVKSEQVESRLEFTAGHIPVDEAEILHRKQRAAKSEGKGSSSAEEVFEYSPPHVEVDEEVVLPVKSVNFSAEVPLTNPDSLVLTTNHKSSDNNLTDSPRKSNKKAKNKANTTSNVQVDENGGISAEDVMSTINQSTLSRAQLQELAEALLDKHGSNKWEKKSSSAERMDKLQKQVESLQQALEGEKVNTKRMKDQLQEANNNLTLAERNHRNKMQEMQMRMQQSHDQQRAEVQGIQQARFQEIQRMQQHIQQVREENQTLRQALPNTDEMAQMKSQLRTVEAELKDQQRHVHKAENKCQDLTTRLTSALEAHRKENMRCVELARSVEEFTYNQSKLKNELQETKTRAHAAENDLRNLQDHLRAKDEEIKAMHAEILSAKQATSDSLSSSTQADNSHIQQLEGTVSSLQSSLHAKDVELSDLQEQLTQTKDELIKAQTSTKALPNGSAGNENDADHEKVSQLEDQVLKLETEVQSLKDKNNELRKKNWTMSESLNKAENAAASVSVLEAELDEKSSNVHELKAINQSLKTHNSELQEKLDQVNSSNAVSDDLKQQLRQLKQELEEKTDIAQNLELLLGEEKEKVTATELECKHLLESELHRSLATIENQHKSRIDDLQSLLDQSEARITDLEKLLHQSESKFKNSIEDANTAGIEDLERKLSQVQDENLRLKVKVSQMESSNKDSKSVSATDIECVLKRLAPSIDLAPNLSIEQSLEEFHKHTRSTAEKENAESQANHYKQALVEAEKMLDQLSVSWLDKINAKDTQIKNLQEKVGHLQDLRNRAASKTSTVSSSSNSDTHTQTSSSSSEAMKLASSGSLQDVSSTV